MNKQKPDSADEIGEIYNVAAGDLKKFVPLSEKELNNIVDFFAKYEDEVAQLGSEYRPSR